MLCVIDMENFIYWFTSISATFIAGYITYRHMNKIKNVKINQTAEEMEDIQGAKFQLRDGEDTHIKDMEIFQDAKKMKNVSGLLFETSGKQSARLQDVRIKQRDSEVIISDDPNVRVEINKQIEK